MLKFNIYFLIYYILDIMSYSKSTVYTRVVNYLVHSASLRCIAQMMILMSLFISTPTLSKETGLYFNPRFLSDDQGAVADLSGFEKGQEVPQGTYRVDIYMNDTLETTRDVTFRASAKEGELMPCLSREQLTGMGVNFSVIKGTNALVDEGCVPLPLLIKGATTRFDVGQQRLYLTIPQIYMSRNGRGYIPPELWDNGIDAGLLNYNFTGNNVRNNVGASRNYAYMSLMSGLNLGAWRFRDNTNWSYSSGGGPSKNKWQHINTWIERNIIPLRSRLTLGDSYTNGEIFEGTNFRGVKIESDDNMLPDSQTGFAPVIRGIARGTAQVSIKQNGYEIYQTTVPPGPFAISDLYASGSSGNIEVTIKEADGTRQVFTQPWSSVAVLQREGHTRYAITAGESHSGNKQQEAPKFFQSTAIQGLPSGWTMYGGTLFAARYQAFNIGVGKDMGMWGATSLDTTQADATLPDGSKHQGQSFRFLYNKALNEWGTNIQLVGYRYSTQGYFGFSDTNQVRMKGYSVETQDGIIQIKPKFSDYYNLNYRKRNNIQVSLNQTLGNITSVYLGGSRQSYWRGHGTDEQLQAGLITTIGDISWTLSYSLTKSVWQQAREQMLAVNLSVPLSHWTRSDNTSIWQRSNASYNMSHAMNGPTNNQIGLYGTLLDDNNLGYGVQSGYTSGGSYGSDSVGNVALNYRGRYGSTNIGYSRSESFKQLYYGFNGGVLAHADGITLSQRLNDTIVLIKAPGADNVKVENQPGVSTDWRGYAVLPYATEYRENRVALNTDSLPDNVDLDNAVLSVVPTRGAVVRAGFSVHKGMKLLMTLQRNGQPLPFGSVVTAEGSQGSSIVADDGQVYMSGMPTSGQVLATWGRGPFDSCVADYRISPENQKKNISMITAQCRPGKPL